MSDCRKRYFMSSLCSQKFFPFLTQHKRKMNEVHQQRRVSMAIPTTRQRLQKGHALLAELHQLNVWLRCC